MRRVQGLAPGAWVAVSVSLVAFVALAAAGCGGGGSVGTLAAPGKSTARLSASELQGRWWTWATSTGDADNPVSDPDGSFCAVHQPGDVWFLAGDFGGKAVRRCHVPAARPLAFPLVNLVGSTGQCSAFMADAAGSATLDGAPLAADRYDATEVSVTAVDGNPLGLNAGTSQGYACGIWVQVPAVASGSHQLVIKGTSGGFSVEADYSLTVG